MADKTFTQMTDEEFKQLLDSIRGSAGQGKYSYDFFSIDCLRKEAIDLTRLTALLEALKTKMTLFAIWHL